MKQVCLHCSRQAPLGSLWCLEAACAADDKPALLEPGTALGEIEVTRMLSVLPSATLYAAERRGPAQPERVLLKVAHAGQDERLKREARLLARLQARTRHPALPWLLPAHSQAGTAHYPYGKSVAGGMPFYYAVFRYLDGEPLSSMLLDNAQPWYQHAGWLALALADALALLHAGGVLHLALSPPGILVRFDQDGIPRPVLLDLGV
ncbi:MAG: hypothetical protein ACKOC5_03505, partial [Chloroflexota bacterium]